MNDDVTVKISLVLSRWRLGQIDAETAIRRVSDLMDESVGMKPGWWDEERDGEEA